MRTNKPALVISDKDMGSFSGVALRREMLKEPELARIPFILHSAGISESEITVYKGQKDINFLDVLDKGDLDKLKEYINEIISF